MSQKTVEISRVDFQEWVQAFTALTGFDDPVFWKSLRKNPDFDTKGLFKASINSESQPIVAGVICAHSLPSRAVIDTLFLNHGELSRDLLDLTASELILSAVNRLKSLGSEEIVSRVSHSDPNKVYFEKNSFVSISERVHLSKAIEKPASRFSKKAHKKQSSGFDIIKITSDEQIREFAELTQLILNQDDDSDPLTEKDIREWLIKDPSFGLNQMFFAIDRKTGKKAGVGHFFYYPAERRGGIFGIGVLEEYRGQGVSSKLISAIIACISSKGGTRAYIECYKGSDAEKIYKHMGFTVDYTDSIMRYIDDSPP
ncbi:MAG: GNAT family N-acetyltransferase [Candidatus Odinarchaeota archaeon]